MMNVFNDLWAGLLCFMWLMFARLLLVSMSWASRRKAGHKRYGSKEDRCVS